jgi:hypothetical protein
VAPKEPKAAPVAEPAVAEAAPVVEAATLSCDLTVEPEPVAVPEPVAAEPEPVAAAPEPEPVAAAPAPEPVAADDDFIEFPVAAVTVPPAPEKHAFGPEIALEEQRADADSRAAAAEYTADDTDVDILDLWVVPEWTPAAVR